MKRYFGTDGIRGKVNDELTAELAFEIGKSAAYTLKENGGKGFFLGKDTRISCDMLAAALTAGITAMGMDVYNCGVIPTPAVALITNLLGATAGIMVSASHNPPEFNGIKFIFSDGYKLSDSLEEKIEENLRVVEKKYASATSVGRFEILPGAKETYIRYVLKRVVPDFDLKGMKIVVDTANGAAYTIAPEIFRLLGARVSVINNIPDGLNINERCGSTHPDMLSKTVITEGADCGIAFDGDADRCIMVDEQGNVVDGDKLMVINALDMFERKRLKANTVVATVMSNIGMEIALKSKGIKIERTTVGDRYVVEKMRQIGANIGGEQAGHIIFADYSTTGDGIITALLTLKVMITKGHKLSSLASVVDIYPQVVRNVPVRDKEAFLKNKKIKEKITGINDILMEGRIVVRPSGTEPVIRIMIEGKDEKEITAIADDVSEFITRRLGGVD
ncbi:MAG: phosphoglucosamine mutase [Thermotogae bacterium]|nr:phosphoglucosamine mutase [Thermotogota bacterium]